RDKLRGRGAHHQQPGLQIPARVCDDGIAMDAVEGPADFDVAGRESNAVGEKSNHRDDAEHNDAGANRQLREDLRDEHDWTECGSWLPRRVIAAFHVSKTENG